MDRDELKRRGKTHLYKKNKYDRKKTGKVFETEKREAESEEESVTVLPSNRDRYKSISDDDDDKITDFTLLENAPISVGGHFQFKGDQHELPDLSDSFLNLDVKLLNYSLSTIPFHIRCGIDEQYIESKYLQEINQKTARNKKIYEQYLQTVKLKQKHEIKDTNNRQNVDKETKVADEMIFENNPSVETSKNTDTINNTEKEELEDWLDDILKS